MSKYYKLLLLCCVINVIQSILQFQTNKLEVEDGSCFIFQKSWYNFTKKHLNAKNGLIAKRIEEEMNLKSLMEKQLAQKQMAINPSAILKNIVTINPFKKNNVQ